MKKTELAFVILVAYLVLTGVLLAFIVATPFLEYTGNSGAALFLYHDVFTYFCHQKISRSYCVFKSDSGYSIGDCMPQLGKFVNDSGEQISTISNGVLGYKFPVCARNFSIFLFMFIGGIIYPLVRRFDSQRWPTPLLLILFLAPMALDGFTQLFGLRESTNLLRFFTGALAGIVIPFYLIPMANRMFASIWAGRLVDSDKNADEKYAGEHS